MPNLHLLPRPKTLTLTGGDRPLPEVLSISGADAALIAATLGDRGRSAEGGSATVHCVVATDASTDDDGYVLEIGAASPIRLSARTRSGLRWGLTTLNQILSQCGNRIPLLRIDDAPAFAVRGVMLDISRDRVPTMASLRDLVATLSRWKINHLQLYIEHTFAYRGHEDVWRASSPITADEMRELDRLCTDHGIELTANQNCLGHVERWLKVPGYGHLGERTAGHLIFGSWYVDPNTLVANDPEGLSLVRGLLDQLLPCCSGRYAHIGCDEPWDLGTGRSKAAVDTDGFHAVYARHVTTVASFARAHGKRALYWSDPEHLAGAAGIDASKAPHLSSLLPTDVVPVVWGYDPDTDFAARGRRFRERGFETWLAPSTNCWVSFTGRVHERRGNLARAARDGAAIGATGILNTIWGDNGHRQQWPLTLAGIADGAQAQWSGDVGFDDDAMGLHAFGSPALGRWLIAFGDVDLELRRHHGGLFQDSKQAFFHPWKPGDAALWQAVDDRFAQLETTLPHDVTPQVRDECAHALAIARYAAQRAVLRRGAPTVDERRALASRLAELLADHRRLWLLRSRPGGLEQSCDWYRQLIQHH
ncbi:MAG: family 20 glycosylhydrolase [Planctomycetes bacterium]|nr:family 20 glycosylhydrolase [Planctomycetota bacterium]